MTEPEDIPPRRLDLSQALFWVFLAIGVGAAGVAVTAGPTAGRAGAILLILLAATGMVLFVWLSRGPGRKYGAFPERGVIEASALGRGEGPTVGLEALEEPALLTDRRLSPLGANAAYIALAEAVGAMGDHDRPPTLSRLLGADPLLSAAVFRLSRAAQAGQRRREELPLTSIGLPGPKRRFEAGVSPTREGDVLWRLTPIGEAEQADGAAEAGLFIEDAPFGFLAVSAEGQVAFMNRTLRAILGWGGEQGALRLRDVVREDLGLLARRERRAPAGGARAPVTLRARDGLDVPAYAAFAWPQEDQGGAFNVYLHLTEEAPSGAPSRPEASPNGADVFQTAPFGAAFLDAADPAAASILDANAALMEMTAGRAAPGAVFADLFDASEGPVELASRLRKAVDSPGEFQLAGGEGNDAHVEFVRLADGRMLAYLLNLSERRELEQRLAQAEKMREIGMLAGGVAHDFNNLLMVVMQNCDYLLSRHPVGDPDYFDLNEINNHALRAKELSEMLRAYARQQTFRREVFDPDAFIAEIRTLLRRLVGDGVEFEIRHGRDVPLIRADRAQLERVLVNLVANARDAMTPKGQVLPRSGALSVRTLRTTAEEARALGHAPIEDGDYLLIEVQDTGSGIRPEDAAKIFRPFHSTKEQGKGTGLGLATSYGIIKQSGGYIFFSSELGKGTTFRLYLPAHAPTSKELEELQRKERDQQRRTVNDVAGVGSILLVEDEAGLRKAIARNLTQCGFEVSVANDGEAGLHMLRAQEKKFDLIISDVSMPVMTGPEMVREAGPELLGKARVLFLSGFAPESFESTLQELPVSYMSKPVGMPALVQRVKSLLAEAA